MRKQNKLITLNNKIFNTLKISFQFDVEKNLLYKRIEDEEKKYYFYPAIEIQSLIDKNKSYSNLMVHTIEKDNFVDIIIRNKTVEEVLEEERIANMSSEEFIFGYLQELINK